MWFKNLKLFRLESPLDLDSEALEKVLSGHLLKPCGRLEAASFGWVSPFGREAELLSHGVHGAAFLTWGSDEKVLPSAVVQEAVAEKVHLLEKREPGKVSRKRRLSIKDEVLHSLLPQAFARPIRVDLLLDNQTPWLIVNTPSSRVAEDIVQFLRITLGTLRAVTLEESAATREILTSWLVSGKCPDDFEFGEECELKSASDDGATVRCRKQLLTSSEILQHLEHGKEVLQLGLNWSDRLEFVLGSDLTIRKLRFSDQVTAQLDDVGADMLAELDAIRALQIGEIRALVGALGNHFSQLR